MRAQLREDGSAVRVLHGIRRAPRCRGQAERGLPAREGYDFLSIRVALGAIASPICSFVLHRIRRAPTESSRVTSIGEPSASLPRSRRGRPMTRERHVGRGLRAPACQARPSRGDCSRSLGALRPSLTGDAHGCVPWNRFVPRFPRPTQDGRACGLQTHPSMPTRSTFQHERSGDEGRHITAPRVLLSIGRPVLDFLRGGL